MASRKSRNSAPVGGVTATAGREVAPSQSVNDASAGASKDEISRTVGENLRRYRGERGYTLDGLAQLSGVSRAMLGQIELGQSAPTVNVLWKIVAALDLPFAALISTEVHTAVSIVRAKSSKSLVSFDGSFRSRALFPFDASRNVEFYELRLEPGGREQAEPHAGGTTENLVVARGSVVLELGADKHLLDEGDAIHFVADRVHAYANRGSKPAILYLVMTYTRNKST
jgi:transcriptional regulator with XRE-family HTH domain